MSADRMEKLLEEVGTPAEYRAKYLKLGEQLLGWRFQPATGSYNMGQRFMLHEGMALRWLRGDDGVRAVLGAMFNNGWRMQCECWGERNRFHYQASFIRGSGWFLFRSVIKGEQVYSFQDAVLLAAVETLG